MTFYSFADTMFVCLSLFSCHKKATVALYFWTNPH